LIQIWALPGKAAPFSSRDSYEIQLAPPHPCSGALAAFALLTASATASEEMKSAVAQLWHIAPPAPQIAENDRLAELGKRRAEVMKRMGDKGVLVLFSTEPRVYTNDVDYHYRQENNLYYLNRHQAGRRDAHPAARRESRRARFFSSPNAMRATRRGMGIC
jgi:hypothetical protein